MIFGRMIAMKPLILKDNTPYKEDEKDFSSYKAITDKLLDKSLKYLQDNEPGLFVFPEDLSKTELDGGSMVLKRVDGDFKTGNVAGFVGCKEERLIIRSRFTGDDEEQVDHFFLYMLSKVLKIPNVIDLQTGIDLNDQLFDLLLFAFPQYLKSAMRKGIFKQYVGNQYNDVNIKGYIDIPRHIKRNTPFMGKVAYNMRESSYDNYLTQLIRHTLEYMKTRPIGRAVLPEISDE